jgi:hypothetical protein
MTGSWLAHVARVGEQLAHEVDERSAAHHVQALVAIRGEQHVPRSQRHALCYRDRLLPERAHVERDLGLALRALHAVVEDSCQQHVPQAKVQLIRIEVRCRTDCTVPSS